MSTHPQRPRALLILGMHRSGTSAATRVINLLGADIGKNILLPGQGNSEGFWEHVDAVTTNHYLLKALGRTWFDIRRIPQGWVQHPVGREAVTRISSIIQRDFASRPLVAVKDPRMCLTAPVWIESFKALGFDVECVFVMRDPREVIDSLHAREKWPREPIFLLWVNYMTEAILATRQCRRTLITYDQLLADWRSTMRHVSSELSLAWPKSEEDAATEIDDFLDQGHRHHVAARHSEKGHALAGMPPFVAALYEKCLAIANGRADWGALDEAALSYQHMANLYTAHLDNLVLQQQEMEKKMTEKVQAFEKLLQTMVGNAQQKS